MLTVTMADATVKVAQGLIRLSAVLVHRLNTYGAQQRLSCVGLLAQLVALRAYLPAAEQFCIA